MLPSLLICLPLVLAQEKEPVRASPFDVVVELELTAEDEALVDARGPTQIVEYEVEFEGTLHIWTRSELDLFLRVEDAAEFKLLKEDDDSGGGKTPYLRLDVSEGDLLAILIAGAKDEIGPLEIHLVAAPETEATREAAAAGRQSIFESSRMARAGNLVGARDDLRTTIEELAAVLGRPHSQLIADLFGDIGLTAYRIGSIESSRRAWSLTEEQRDRTLPPDHPLLLLVRANLATAMEGTGDTDGAYELRKTVLAAYERTLPPGHILILRARAHVANSMMAMGDISRARDLRESVLADSERVLPPDHNEVLKARANLAVSMHAMGDIHDALVLRQSVLAAWERTLPPDHPDLVGARANLAVSKLATGDTLGARALQEAVLVARERTFPADHPRLLDARASLAATMHDMGELAGARALKEAVLEGYNRKLPPENPRVLMAKGNLAISMHAMGDIPGARALQEAVLAGYAAKLSSDHPDLLIAQSNLTASMYAMGDLAGTRSLQEAVLNARERSLPPNHPSLLRARANLAVTLQAIGDFAGARAMQESVLSARQLSLPPEHPDLLMAQSNLATSMLAMGDTSGARALQEEVLTARERNLSPNHPDLLAAQSHLAASMQAMGDLASSRDLQEAVLTARERSLPPEHPDLLWSRGNLAKLRAVMGDIADARNLVPELCRGMHARILVSLTLAPREMRQTVGADDELLSIAYFFSARAGSRLQVTVFELMETMRVVAGEAARSLRGFDTDPELGSILRASEEVRRNLNDLVAGTGRIEESADRISDEVTRLSLERDRLEGRASRRLSELGVEMRPIEVGGLASTLGPTEALVGYRRLTHCYEEDGIGLIQDSADLLVAHVLRSDGSLTRVNLGHAIALEELATSWRTALGAPLQRGVGLESEAAGNTEAQAGQVVRERLFDPVLAAAGDDVQRLFICVDDLVFLLPLDALPMDEEGTGRLGDHLQIVNEVSFARLLSPAKRTEGTLSLLALGGVDYDAQGATQKLLIASSAPIEAGGPGRDVIGEGATNEGNARGARPRSFQPLLQARYEVEATGDLFEEAFEIEPTLLTREESTKAALFEAAPNNRYLHLATHGWFAPDSIRSAEDAPLVEATFARMRIAERVSGLAPMILCGLALAGANNGRDSLGRVPGILTAEELCSLDLSQCELAVLSACETNVGIRRAGQGIQSLQSALYAAGARTSITSLWKVDDAATRRLMEVFYTNLWIEKMGKAESLWQAKKALRDEGHPPASWAGWVLTGNPD